MFEQVLVPSKDNATITLPSDLYGMEVRVIAVPLKSAERIKKKTLLPPHINTNSWKFNREEANER
jgi:hypothetical protein